MGVEIFHNLKSVLESKNLNTSVGDEGGFAPNLKSNEEAIDVIMEAMNGLMLLSVQHTRQSMKLDGMCS